MRCKDNTLYLYFSTVGKIVAVLATARGAVVARGDDDVVFDDDGTVFLAQAGASLGNRLRNVQIIIVLGYSFHM